MAARIFTDREEAGRLLAESLMHLRDADPIALALPRGGVPVALPVARALHCPLDLVLVRKLGAPQNPELAIGAVAGTVEQPDLYLNQHVVDRLGVPPDYVRAAAAEELAVIDARRRAWLGGRPQRDIGGRTAILVDDGIATGATAALALRILRQRGPARLVLAVPVAPAATVSALSPLCDEVVCLEQPEDFYGVGQFYRNFGQLDDETVVQLLGLADRGME